jgi:hypothetical protein
VAIYWLAAYQYNKEYEAERVNEFGTLAVGI